MSRKSNQPATSVKESATESSTEQRKTRRTARQTLLEKTEACIDQHNMTFREQLLFRSRRRDMELNVAKLRRHGRKCGGQFGEECFLAVSEIAFGLADKLERR